MYIFLHCKNPDLKNIAVYSEYFIQIDFIVQSSVVKKKKYGCVEVSTRQKGMMQYNKLKEGNAAKPGCSGLSLSLCFRR